MERNSETSIPVIVQGAAIPMRNWNSRFFDCLKDPCLSIYTAFGLLPCVLVQISGRIKTYPCFGSFKGFYYAMLFLGSIYFTASFMNGLIERWGVRIYDGHMTYEIYTFNNALNLVLLSFFCALVWSLRYHVRKKLNIFGDDPTDAIYSLCCPCCAVVQMARELDLNASHVVSCKEPNPFELDYNVQNNVTVGLQVSIVDTKEERVQGADSV
jgi:Cys-rich protein (TIGR01571 family)